MAACYFTLTLMITVLMITAVLQIIEVILEGYTTKAIALKRKILF